MCFCENSFLFFFHERFSFLISVFVKWNSEKDHICYLWGNVSRECFLKRTVIGNIFFASWRFVPRIVYWTCECILIASSLPSPDKKHTLSFYVKTQKLFHFVGCRDLIDMKESSKGSTSPKNCWALIQLLGSLMIRYLWLRHLL